MISRRVSQLSCHGIALASPRPHRRQFTISVTLTAACPLVLGIRYERARSLPLMKTLNSDSENTERSPMTKSRKEWPLTPEAALESLEAFVVRARRIEAHSLVRSGEVGKLAEQTFTTTVETATNAMTVRLDRRPEDEEIFESLAARIRPCTIGDPVNIRKAARSLKLLAGAALTMAQTEALDNIINWYDYHIEEQNAIFSFEEIDSLDDPAKTVSASDVTLGMGWLYSDLIHANPNPKISVALEFPYNSRYQNGVVLISHLALKIIELLELIREIDSKHTLNMKERVWADQVCAGAGPLDLHNAKVFIGEPLHDVSHDTRSEDINGLEPLTAMRMTQLKNPHRVANLVCSDESGDTIACFPGIYRFSDGIISVNIDYVATLNFYPANSPRVLVNPLPEGSLGVFSFTPFDGKRAELNEIIETINSADEVTLELKRKNGALVIPFRRAESTNRLTPTTQGSPVISTE